MDASSESGIASLQLEALKQTDLIQTDIQNVSDFAFSRIAFLSNTEPTANEISAIPEESQRSFRTLQKLKDLPDYERPYEHGIPASKEVGLGEQSGDLFIQIDDSDPDHKIVKPAIFNEEEQNDSLKPIKILSITGAKNGNFTCVLDGEEKQVVSIPRETVYQAQVLAEQHNILTGITDESTRTVVQLYIDSLQGKQSDSQVDQQTLIEAAKNSGQVTTESLKKFIEKSLPEKPDDIEFSEKRKTIIEGLGSHTVATKEDFVTVLAFSGPEKIATYKSELEIEIATKREDLKKLQGTAEGTRIQKELEALHARMTDFDAAAEFYKDPTKLENFVDIMTSGKLTKEEANKISGHFENGEMVDAMKEMAVAKIKNLTEDEEKKLFTIFGMKPEQAMMAATGGALLLLIVLMMNGLKGQ